MKNLKLGNAYIDAGAIIRQDIPVKSWKEVKQISKELSESEGKGVSIRLASFSDLFERKNTMKLNCERNAVTIYLSCDLDFVINLLITDIVKAEIKKVSCTTQSNHGRDVYEEHYQADYILKPNENKIESYSFHTDDKLALKHFMETVSVKAIPSGKLDTPTNKKLVKLNRNALRKIRKNQI